MPYANALIKTPFNYGLMRSVSTGLVELNPLGTCFNLCCLWVQELFRDPNQSSAVLREKMVTSIMMLALRHKMFMKAVDAKGISEAERTAAWAAAIAKYDFVSASLGAGGGVVASRVPDSSSSSDRASFAQAYIDFGFSGAAIGDIWGVIWKFVEMQPRPYGCIFNTFSGPDKAHQTGGHAISIFVPVGGQFRIRIFDMNAGEWLIECEDHWRTWSKGLDDSMLGDAEGPINFVQLMDLIPR